MSASPSIRCRFRFIRLPRRAFAWYGAELVSSVAAVSAFSEALPGDRGRASGAARCHADRPCAVGLDYHPSKGALCRLQPLLVDAAWLFSPNALRLLLFACCVCVCVLSCCHRCSTISLSCRQTCFCPLIAILISPFWCCALQVPKFASSQYIGVNIKNIGDQVSLTLGGLLAALSVYAFLDLRSALRGKLSYRVRFCCRCRV